MKKKPYIYATLQEAQAAQIQMIKKAKPKPIEGLKIDYEITN